ncbi:MAG: cell division protein FtsH, partial [Bdellovibrionia bacterium]
MALGVTQTLPEEERMNLTKRKAENMISFLFGGRVAEALIFHDYTTGAGNDIERATEIARRMVTEWGMSEKLGPQKYESRDQMPFMGMGHSNQKEYSDSKAEEIDQEVSRLISEGYEKAKKILEEKTETLHKLAEALLEKETLDGDEVQIIMNGGTLADIDREREVRRKVLAKQNAHQEEKDAKGKTETGKKIPIGDSGPVTA